MKKKNILLGITGSIAAYKAPSLVRILVKEGFDVKCVLTDAGARFVTAETLKTLSRNRVYSEMFSDDYDDFHISLSKWADIILVAPATCDALARISSGRCEDLLSATVISARCPVMFAPAMNSAMWSHPATKENAERLKKRGAVIIPPEKGELACGDEGDGRLANLEKILSAVKTSLGKQ
ncbi:MAG: flavoprotein [Endomicrobiia bacterium]|nr:flavoprotein [Endomicrobiia bacterium]